MESEKGLREELRMAEVSVEIELLYVQYDSVLGNRDYVKGRR